MLRGPNKAKTDRSSPFLLNKFIIHLSNLLRGKKFARCDQLRYPFLSKERRPGADHTEWS